MVDYIYLVKEAVRAKYGELGTWQAVANFYGAYSPASWWKVVNDSKPFSMEIGIIVLDSLGISLDFVPKKRKKRIRIRHITDMSITRLKEAFLNRQVIDASSVSDDLMKVLEGSNG